MSPRTSTYKTKAHPNLWKCILLSGAIASFAHATESRESECHPLSMECNASSKLRATPRSHDGDDFALTFLKSDLLEAAITNKEGLAPKKYSDELKSLGTTTLEKLQRQYGYDLVKHQFDSGAQDHKDCLQLKPLGLTPILTLQAIQAEKGPDLFSNAVADIKSRAKAASSHWKPKYSVGNSSICMLSDTQIGETKIKDYVKTKGMKGYLKGLRPLTSEARLPTQYIGYLVYADGEDDYVVIQSFGNKALASSVTDSTPVLIDFGNDAPLSEGSSLEGLYLRLLKIGPYETTTGAPRNAFIFQAIAAPQLPRVMKLK